MKSLMDLHVHTCHSTHWLWGQSCLVTPRNQIDAAIKLGLKALAITDHDSIDGNSAGMRYARDKDFIVVPGIEVSSKDGHILGLGVNELIPKKLSAEDTVDRIKDQGALAIAAHPAYYLVSLGKKVRGPKLDAIEGFNARCAITNKRSQEYAKELKLPVTGGSDAHSISEVGNGYSVTNVAINSVDDVLKAVKRGKLTVEGRSAHLFGQVLTASMLTLISKVYTPLKPDLR